jgi:hypothetical protein
MLSDMTILQDLYVFWKVPSMTVLQDLYANGIRRIDETNFKIQTRPRSEYANL